MLLLSTVVDGGAKVVYIIIQQIKCRTIIVVSNRRIIDVEWIVAGSRVG
jgi:hypothetical protein